MNINGPHEPQNEIDFDMTFEKMKELMYDAMVELMGKDKADKKLDNYDIKLLDKDLHTRIVNYLCYESMTKIN